LPYKLNYMNAGVDNILEEGENIITQNSLHTYPGEQNFLPQVVAFILVGALVIRA